jgi:hypothetical protein
VHRAATGTAASSCSSAASSQFLEEDSTGSSLHRPPDPTFVAVAFAWAAGEGFAEVVEPRRS